MSDAENSGGFVNYYLAKVDNPQREDQQPYQAECEDIIRALGMTFDEGNIFKEVWRRAAARQGKQKLGHSSLRSGEKLKHYGAAIHRQDVIDSAKTIRVRTSDVKAMEAVLRDAMSSGVGMYMDKAHIPRSEFFLEPDGSTITKDDK